MMRSRGFSLVEAIVVVAIGAVLIGILATALRSTRAAALNAAESNALRSATIAVLSAASDVDDHAPGPDPAASVSDPVRYGDIELGANWVWAPSAAWPNRVDQELGLPAEPHGTAIDTAFFAYRLDSGRTHWQSAFMLSAAFVFDPATMHIAGTYHELRPATQRYSRVRVPSRKGPFIDARDFASAADDTDELRVATAAVDGSVNRIATSSFQSQGHASLSLPLLVLPTVDGVRGSDW
jgi:prepilin-type N-terminal cleavage/methylation domain-containing protein